MGIWQKTIEFIPNFVKGSMYFGHQLGDTVLPNLLSKTGLSPVMSQLLSLPITATVGGAAMWFGAINVVKPLLLIPLSVIAPPALLVAVPTAMLFGGMLAAGIGMGDSILKKFGKTPVFDNVYDNVAYKRERKIKLADKAAREKQAAQELQLAQQYEQQRQAANQKPSTTAPGEIEKFAGFGPGTPEAGEEPSTVGNRNAAASFNGASTEVPKFAGIAPKPDTEQGPRERPPHPGKPS